MLSKVTVEIDYNNQGRPYFRVMENATSDDLKDKAVTQFRRVFNFKSLWCKVDFGQVQMDGTIQWNIHPIPPEELAPHASAMQSIDLVTNPEPYWVERLNEMCTESLPPDAFEKWEEVKAILRQSRQALK